MLQRTGAITNGVARRWHRRPSTKAFDEVLAEARGQRSAFDQLEGAPSSLDSLGLQEESPKWAVADCPY